MNESISMKNLLSRGVMLVLCLMLVLPATGLAQEICSVSGEAAQTTAAVTSTSGEDVQYEDAGNTPLSIAITTEAAALLVQEQLRAGADWSIDVVELNEENGVILYTIIATDPMGDAHCRLVNAETGEITAVNLWLENGGENKEDDKKDGKQKEKKKEKKSQGEQGNEKQENKQEGDNNQQDGSENIDESSSEADAATDVSQSTGETD